MRLILIFFISLLLVHTGYGQSKETLVNELAAIYESDQAIRKQIGRSYREHGLDSPESKDLLKKMNKVDSLNLVRVTHILDSIGWQGKKVFGDWGSDAIFLVIQHSDLATQEKYLPMIRGATKKGRLKKSNLALLEDRVALGQGKKQIYGSQIWRDEEIGQFYVAPLEDPDNVDKRRKKVGLRPMAEYLKTWDINWSIQEYKDMIKKAQPLR